MRKCNFCKRWFKNYQAIEAHLRWCIKRKEKQWANATNDVYCNNPNCRMVIPVLRERYKEIEERAYNNRYYICPYCKKGEIVLFIPSY